WLDDYEDHFTITATLSKTATRAELKEMLQGLLRDRFHLAAHHETRLFPGYELRVGSHGPKMKEWVRDPNAEWRKAPPPDQGFPQLPPTVIGGISAPSSPEDHAIRATYRQTMGDFAKALGRVIGSVTGTSGGAFAPEVVDKTGLEGIYEFRLEYDGSALSGAAATDGPSTPSGAPNLFTAIENQLGLRLVKSEGVPVDVLVIDHIDKRPTEN
ncbi:MAG TPA: TIGR03435 family protein, partial [Bryobacteraceae bacterium]|nr:TIGR03435 family protein [Bryobacteraceae bacterium]